MTNQLPSRGLCPKCYTLLSFSSSERVSGKFYCPVCATYFQVPTISKSNGSKSFWGWALIILGILTLPIGIIFIIWGAVVLLGKVNKTEQTPRTVIHNRDANDSITDISNISTSSFSFYNSSAYPSLQWEDVKRRLGLSSKESSWLDKLYIPYKRSILSIQQCEDETIKLYLDIVKKVDVYLESKGSSLSKLVTKLNKTGGYYDNILYSIECISESEVGNHYKEYNQFDSAFSYKLLEEHTSKELTNSIKTYLLSRSNDIAPANEETLKKYSPLSAEQKLNRSLQQKLQLVSGGIYRNVPFRTNKFLRNEQVQLETAKVYSSILEFIANALKTSGIPVNTSNFIKKFINEEKPTYGYNWEKDRKLKACLHKLSENILRSVYKVKLLPSATSAEQDLVSLVKKDLGNLVIEHVRSLSDFVEPPLPETLQFLKTLTSNKEDPEVITPPVRKYIEIDTSKVSEISEKNERTVAELNKYLQDNNDVNVEILTKASDMSFDKMFNTDESDESETSFTKVESRLINYIIMNKCTVSNSMIESFASQNKVLRNTVIASINQKFYTMHNDVLLHKSDEGISLDQYYLNIAKNLVHD